MFISSLDISKYPLSVSMTHKVSTKAEFCSVLGILALISVASLNNSKDSLIVCSF